MYQSLKARGRDCKRRGLVVQLTDLKSKTVKYHFGLLFEDGDFDAAAFDGAVLELPAFAFAPVVPVSG